MKNRIVESKKIAFLSSHFSGAIKLIYLLKKKIRIDTIITISDQIADKANVSGYYDFSRIANENGIDIYYVQKFDLSGSDDAKFFRNNDFDILLISGWQRLISEDVLNSLRIGAIGEHGSSEYLPRGRGRSPVNYTIMENRRRFVVHIFKADSTADSGDIIDKDVFQINDFDDVYSVYSKFALSSARLFIKNYEKIMIDNWEPLNEADIVPTYYRKIQEKDNYICWDKSTSEIYNKIRANTHPYPGAKSKIDSSVVTIWRAQPFDYNYEDFNRQFGEVIFCFPNNDFIVKTSDGLLLVTNYDYKMKINEGNILF